MDSPMNKICYLLSLKFQFSEGNVIMQKAIIVYKRKNSWKYNKCKVCVNT